MSKIYLVNVGANLKDKAKARSPLFANGDFVFVPFPYAGAHTRPYPAKCEPFIRTTLETHDDPDWPNLTYGDDCANPRATALKQVVKGDILLFWARLWANAGNQWRHFTGQSGWYMIGALHVSQILGGGEHPPNTRAARNIHFKDGPLPPTHRVFIGSRHVSGLFPKAVDLQIDQPPNGLAYQTIATAGGSPLPSTNLFKVFGSLRSCRCIWDLSVPSELQQATIVRNEVQRQTGYSLF
ncbi:MAG TPA: hypothetical protein VGO56_07435 [Pyrinomonadaceae bacterium]|jgi:hypothetical protein|nr:hypothetical protein [Pyrinomonadaceae bacterium]